MEPHIKQRDNAARKQCFVRRKRKEVERYKKNMHFKFRIGDGKTFLGKDRGSMVHSSGRGWGERCEYSRYLI